MSCRPSSARASTHVHTHVEVYYQTGIENLLLTAMCEPSKCIVARTPARLSDRDLACTY